VPTEVFGSKISAFVVPDGFLVPGHANGGVYVVEVDPTDITKKRAEFTISASDPGFFYHMGQWLDINGDGRLDFLTARSDAKAGDGQLVWLEHPVDGL
jgi:hypothetical protein